MVFGKEGRGRARRHAGPDVAGDRAGRLRSRFGRRPLPHRLRLVDQGSQAVTEFATGPVQPTADRAHGDIEDRADLLVTAPVEVLRTTTARCSGPRRSSAAWTIRSRSARSSGAAGSDSADSSAGWVPRAAGRRSPEPQHGPDPPPPMAGERQVHRDPVDPRVEGAVSLELVELLERADERVLEDVLGVVGRADSLAIVG